MLVLCEPHDAAALWAARGLERRGHAVDVVTGPLLGSALAWDHRIVDGEPSIDITLADGRTINGREQRGVLNRLQAAPTQRIEAVGGTDADYAVQEFHALFLSWLHALPGPVLNRPSPQGLAGAWRHRSGWAVLAARAGLRAVPWYQTDGDPPDRGWADPLPPGTVPVVVIGDEVLVPAAAPARDVEPSVLEGCARLAALAGCALLGVDLAPDGRTWAVAGANPVPELRAGGERLLDVLAAALTPKAEVAA